MSKHTVDFKEISKGLERIRSELGVNSLSIGVYRDNYSIFLHYGESKTYHGMDGTFKGSLDIALDKAFKDLSGFLN